MTLCVGLISVVVCLSNLNHLLEVQLGKGRGPDLRLPKANVCIDITWYCHLKEAHPCALCVVMGTYLVCCTAGKCARVTLLLKPHEQPV